MIPIAKPLFGDEEKKAVLEIVNSGITAQGCRVKTLAQVFINAIEKGEHAPVIGEDGWQHCTWPYRCYNPVWITRRRK